jgi:hypothetical protein
MCAISSTLVSPAGPSRQDQGADQPASTLAVAAHAAASMSFGRRFRIVAGHRPGELEGYFLIDLHGLAPFFTDD